MSSQAPSSPSSTLVTKTLSMLLLVAAVLFIWQFLKDVSLPERKDRLKENTRMGTQNINIEEICLKKICSVEYDLLAASFIWSHRGHYSLADSGGSDRQEGGGSNMCDDATNSSMESLLQAGISNFDVDITIAQNIEQGNGVVPEFIVAHPTAWKNCTAVRNRFQSLQQFIQGIKSHFATSLTHKRLFPTVSIEPKFSNRKSLLQLVDAAYGLISSPFRHSDNEFYFIRIAIIVQNVDSLHFVSDHLRRLQMRKKDAMRTLSGSFPLLTVALSYRSQLLAPEDYTWTAVSADRIRRQRNEIIAQQQQLWEKSKHSERQRIRDDLYLYVKKFHMPDVELVFSHSDESSISSKSRTRCASCSFDLVSAAYSQFFVVSVAGTRDKRRLQSSIALYRK